jgi:regulator of protease activity HflC (stomatin/prohibitin superfamily)
MKNQVPPWVFKAAVTVGFLGLVLVNSPVRFVGNGENLVVFSWFGGVQPQPLQPGFHWVMPLITTTFTFDVKTQALTWKGDPTQPPAEDVQDTRILILTRDGQQIGAEVTLNFVVSDPVKLINTLGPEYIDRIIPIGRSVVASEAAGFAAQDIYSTKRPILQAHIREQISQDLTQYGITVQDLLLRDVAFDKDFVAAIEAKTIAENELGKKAFEIDQSRQDARTVVLQAEAEAGKLSAKANALNENPDYLRVVKSRVLGETLETLVTH